MAVTNSAALRNAWLDTITTTLGAGWKLKLRTGNPPTNVSLASTGTVVATYTPTAAAASAGAKQMIATTVSVAASAANGGSAMHYELTTSGDVVHERGTVTATGGAGDIEIDNLNIASGQTVNVTSLSKTAPGAGT